MLPSPDCRGRLGRSSASRKKSSFFLSKSSNKINSIENSFSSFLFFAAAHIFSTHVDFCGRNLGSFATRQLETGGQRGSQAYNLPSQHFESLIDVAAYAVCIGLFLEAEGQYLFAERPLRTAECG